MAMMRRGVVVLLVVLHAVVLSQGALRLSNALGNNMVLQRAPQQSQLWGWTDRSGQTVVAELLGLKFKCVSVEDGAWTITLPPIPAGGPVEITIRVEKTSEKVTLTNVMFGDVFVCSGQSNMVFSVPGVFNASEEIKLAEKYPKIRLFTVGQGTSSSKPLKEFQTILQPWSVASSASVGSDSPWKYFSGVCWFYGRQIYDGPLKGEVPVGLISTNWGGTLIAAWSGPDALAKCHDEEADNAQTSVGGPNDPSALWNAMITPLLPMTVKAFLWYQGEADIYSDKHPIEFYKCALPAMVEDWRQKFGGPFPFFYVQLSPYLDGGPFGTKLGEFRVAQADALSNVPATCMATAADLGDASSPWGDIHPRDKQTVGSRLALCGRRYLYADSSVVISGPVFAEAHPVSSDPSSVRVAFRADTVPGGKIVVRPDVACPVAKDRCAGWELLSENGWVPARAGVDPDNPALVRVTPVTVGASAAPMKGVRYMIADWPVADTYNTVGLPALPFVGTVS